MSMIRAVVVDPEAPDRLVLREVAAPTPAPSEALVRVGRQGHGVHGAIVPFVPIV